MPVICIAAKKGGVGKTTSAVQLNFHLRCNEFVDLDTNKGLSKINSLREKPFKVHNPKTTKELDKIFSTEKLIIVDCGGYDSVLVRHAIYHSDFVLTPTNDDAGEMLALIDLEELLQELSSDKGEKIEATAIITRVHHARKHFDSIRNHIDGLPHIKMFDSVVPHNTEISMRMFQGEPLRNGQAAAVYGLAAKEIVNVLSDKYE